jgi:hypothetical protein
MQMLTLDLGCVMGDDDEDHTVGLICFTSLVRVGSGRAARDGCIMSRDELEAEAGRTRVLVQE